MGIVGKKVLRKLFLAWLLSLMLLGTFGAFIPQIVSEAPSTVRFLAIVPDDSGDNILHDLEVLTYALQPLDVLNETDITYDHLFSAPNSPRYNLIIWDRWMNIENGDLDLWIDWHYNNGSNVMTFYDGLSGLTATIAGNFVDGNPTFENIPNLHWINMSSTPFTASQDFQYNSTSMGTVRLGLYTASQLKTGVTSIGNFNDTDKIFGWYVEENATHGRAVWWGFQMHSNNPVLPIRVSSIRGVVNTDLTYEFVEPFIESLYWCINAPAIKALRTFALRYDDFARAITESRYNQFVTWWEYMRDKGIPFSAAQPPRNKQCIPVPDPQPVSAVKSQWRNIFTETADQLSNMTRKISEYHDAGWLEITSHGWTHEGNVSGANNEFDEIYPYDNSSADPNFAIKVWLNESMYELSAGVAYHGYSLPVEDINVFAVSGKSVWGNKSSYATYELGAEYLASANPHWSGWLHANGTAGGYFINQEWTGVWMLGSLGLYDQPTDNEMKRYVRKALNAQQHWSLVTQGFCHAMAWSDACWDSGCPHRWIDMIEDSIENSSWSRALWIEDVGDYDKGFKSIVGGHGSINWSNTAPTWDGTTVSISDSVSVPYIIRVPYGRYVSAVTVNGAGWFVFNDNEVYVPASATSVFITTANSAISTPHVQTVRRANRGVTATSYDGDQMTINLNGIKALHSELEVYCGDKGRPVKVTGALSWSYDNTSKILSIIVAHSGSETVGIRWLTGDVNGDGNVDIFDIGVVSAHWYPDPPVGPLGYDSNCDLNSDGAINISDIRLVSAHWGQTW